ncbi:AAA family ATPase [Paradesulfitobacterium aromaticivorans]
MLFKILQIDHWRQYQNLEIKFHNRMTILTGANGAGKTTILNLLNRHFGWNINFVGTYKRDKKRNISKYISDVWRKLTQDEPQNTIVEIGKITYSNGVKAQLTVSNDVSQTYQINMNNMQSISGLHIPSHRPIYSYQPVQTIPTVPQTRQQTFQEYFSLVHNTFLNNYTGKRANQIIKETLISLATFGYGNEVVVPDEEALRTFEEFQNILRIMLPPKLGFQKISIRMPEVILVTNSGEFALDAVSGGIAAIIDLAWQIFMYQAQGEFVVTIDEPENHLHPEIQRSLLPNLIEAFPQVQFIVATHNPFIVSSVPFSNVYVLNYNENNKVDSTLLDLVNKAGTSNDILRDVLGVPVVMPIWVEEKIDNIINRYVSVGINKLNYDSLRKEMKDLGLDKFIPNTIAKVIEVGEIK